MAPGLHDILLTCKRSSLIFYMAWSDIRARYKRSVLGPLWITLSTAIGVVGLGLIWSELFKMDRATYIPTLTVGLVLWQFISGSIVESAGLFGRQSGIIRNLDLPLSLHPAQLVLRQSINLAHSAPLFFAVMLILGHPFEWTMWLAVPNFFLVIANLFWMSLCIGVLGARYRDLEYFITMIMPLLMFVSPVMFRPNALPISQDLIWFNPLADMIELVRDPLLGEVPPLFLYNVNVGLLMVGSVLTLMLFNAKRDRIAFWV